MIDSMQQIKQLCKEYTELSEEDINELITQANHILTRNLYPDNDVFIDVINELTGDAVVIFQREPLSKQSLYSKNIVGEKAQRKMKRLFIAPLKRH